MTRSNEDKARQDKEFEAIAEANKQEWLTKARRAAAEEDAYNEMMHEAQEEVVALGADSKAGAEAMLRKKTAVDAVVAKWRANNEWPLTRAERTAREAKAQEDAAAAKAKMEAEAKANLAKDVKPGAAMAPQTKPQVGPAPASAAPSTVAPVSGLGPSPKG